ncbi:MAG: hypothetical protein F6J87_25665 [Spirulina sp. SIO3F2]|nr:hypothetical protein [Spirulina sp. SIO3F2]
MLKESLLTIAHSTIAVLVLTTGHEAALAASFFLDFDTPTTGSNIINAPLVTSLGTITVLDGELTTGYDPDFATVGASGNKLNIDDLNGALMTFDFDVDSLTFIYGGNSGVFDIVAKDASNNIVDSFFQASTGNGEPAGPITLSKNTSSGIRSIFWQDPGYNFSAIDNITIESTQTVPEPANVLSLLLGVAFVKTMVQKKGNTN